MSQGHKSVLPASIAGGIIFAILWQFKIFRLLILGTIFALSVMWLYDWLFTESTLPADTTGAYEFSANVTQGPDLSWSPDNPKFDVDLSVTNTYNETIQRAIIDTTLYDCADASTPISDCSKVATVGYMPGMDIIPGETWSENHRVTFWNETVNGYPKVTFAIHDVLVDSDNKGDPQGHADFKAAKAKWDAL